MKKITFLLITLISSVGFAQTFDFTNTDDGWTELGAFTAENGATALKLTTKDNATDDGSPGTLKNPSLGTLSAGIDTSVNSFIGVTLKNSSANGPTHLRVSFVRDETATEPKRVNRDADITTGDTEFVTYWFDMNNANWTGTKNDIKLTFKSTGNSNYPLPIPQATIEIDKIELAASIPTTLKENFSFATDNDTEGFSTTNAEISGPVGGILTFTPTPLKFAKLKQTLFHVNATDNKTVRIVLKNNSPVNDQLRFIGGGTTQVQTITTSDTGDKSYAFDLSANADWTGEQVFEIGIGITTGDDAGKAADAGIVEFKSIVIDNSVVLSTESNILEKLSVYPNPSSGIVTITTTATIEKAQLFDISGKKVLETTSLKNNTLNISKLNIGVYFLKLTDNKNNSNTQKLIKN